MLAYNLGLFSTFGIRVPEYHWVIVWICFPSRPAGFGSTEEGTFRSSLTSSSTELLLATALCLRRFSCHSRKIGTMVSDIIIEASMEQEITMGSGLIKEPISPVKNSNGAKAKMVDRVAVRIDTATSFAPLIEATSGLSPSTLSLRSMLSLTTTASSTRIPSTIIKATIEISLMVIPVKGITIIPMAIEIGMAAATTNEVIRLSPNVQTKITAAMATSIS
ncbi:hypothetical protein D3C77_250390 [compost metagenome]